MREVRVHTPEQITAVNAEGVRFSIGPGVCHGHADLTSFTDVAHGVTPDHGFMSLVLSLMAPDGQAYSHRSVLAMEALLPLPADQVGGATGAFRRHTQRWVCLKDQAELSRWVRSLFDDWPAEAPNALFEIQMSEESLDVRLHAMTGEPSQFKRKSLRAWEYSVPYGRLLWRRAPLVTDSRVQLEVAPFVLIRPIGAMAPGYFKLPSPITVIDPGGSSFAPPADTRPKSIWPPKGGRTATVAFFDDALRSASARASTRVLSRDSESRDVATSSGTLRVPAVPIEGVLTLAPQRLSPDGEDAGAHLLFDFRDAAGGPLRHASVIHFGLLLPNEHTRAELVEEPPPTGLRLQRLLDGRDEYTFNLVRGEPIKGCFKYTDSALTLRLADGDDAIDVWLRFHHGSDPRAKDDFFTIRYRLPVSHLLWRRAPLVYEDDLLAEASDVVLVEPLTSPPPGVAPSAATLLRSAQQ